MDGPGPNEFTANANRMFKCHGCERWINQGSFRQSVRNSANSAGLDHFCYVCITSAKGQGRPDATLTEGRLPRPVGGSTSAGREAVRSSGGASSSSRAPRSQLSPPERGGCYFPTDCAGADEDIIDVGEEGKEEAPEEEDNAEDGGGAPEEEEPGEKGPEEEEPEEKEAEEDDPWRWNSASLQVALSRLGRAVVAFLPTIAENGSILPPKKKASGGKGKVPAEPRLSPRDAAAAFRRKFPLAPVCHPLESVETRAIEVLQPKAATLAMKNREKEGADMGQMLRMAAMSVFATINVVVALYVHEVVFFEELVGLKPFQVQTSNGIGVKMICPGCRSNEFVKTPGTSCHGFPSLSWQRVRVAHDVDGVVMPVTGKYSCSSPKCPLVIERAQKAAKADPNAPGDIDWENPESYKSYCKAGATFSTMDDRYMKLLPEAIVAKLPFRFFKQNAASEGLMDRVRATEGDTQVQRHFHRIMVAGSQGQELRDMMRYIRFVEDQQTAERKSRLDGNCTMWPGWKFIRGTLISTPSVTVLNTFYKAGHEEDKDHMQAELESLVSGSFLNCDATFRIAGRTTDEAGCLFLAMGEDAKVHAFGALRSESRAEMTPLLMRYRDRRERSGTLVDLKYVYDDRCCQQLGDPTKHFVPEIFPYVTRAPFADAFHMIQNVAGSTTSKDHPRRVVFARGIGQAVRFKHEEDLEAVTQYLLRSGMDKTMAEAKAKSKGMSAYVRTKSRPKHEMIDAVKRVVALHAELDAKGREQGELPLLAPPKRKGKSGPAGTDAVVAGLVSCLGKGCGCDPLPVEDMHMKLGRGAKTNLMSYSKKGGTGKNEAFHSSLNCTVAGTSRIGPEACQRKLLHRIHRHNFEMDRKHGRTSKQSTLWVWRERAANDAAKLCLIREPFPKAGPPPQVSKDGFEPMGFEYAKRMRQDKLDTCRNEAVRISSAKREAQRSTVESSRGESGISRDPPRPLAGVRDAAGIARVEDQPGGLPQPLRHDCLAVTETSRTGSSAVGEAVGGEVLPTVNLGGARVKHARRPTVESQRPLTPRSAEEVTLLSQSLAKAQRSHEKDVPAAAVQLYNTAFYVEQFSSVLSPTIRAPTSTEKVKKLSIETAAHNASKNVEKLAAAFSKGHSTASEPPTASKPPASEPPTASKPPVQPKRKHNRWDVHAAKHTVASGTPLESGKISILSDTLATAYLRSLRLSANGNRDAKRQRLQDYFTAHKMESYSPPVDQGMGEAAGAAVEAGAETGTGVDAGVGVGTGAGAGAAAVAVAGVDLVQSARPHGVGGIAAISSRGGSSLEGLRSI